MIFPTAGRHCDLRKGFRKRLSAWLALLLFSTSSALGQASAQKFIDSANAVLSAAAPDTHKVNLLLDVAYESRYANRSEAMDYARQAQDLAAQLRWVNGQAGALHFIGAMLNIEGNRSGALAACSEALELYESIGHPTGVFKVLSEIGKAHALSANFVDAKAWYQKALAQAMQANDTASMAFAYSNLASIHGMVSEWKPALQNFQKGLSLAEQTGDRQSTLLPLANIAQVHNEMGNYALSEDYYLRALEVTREFRFLGYQASILTNLINAYTSQRNYAAAQEIYLEGMRLARQVNDPMLVAGFFNAQLKIRQEQGKYAEARSLADSVLQLATSIGNTRLLLQGNLSKGALLNEMAESSAGRANASALVDAAASCYYAAQHIIQDKGFEKEKVSVYEGLKAVYTQREILDSITRYYDLYIAAKDSIYTKEKAKEIANLEAVREAALKGKEIELLQEKEAAQEARLHQERTTRNSLIGGFLLILAAFGWFFWSRSRMNRLKLANQQLESERLQYQLDSKKKDLVDFALDNTKKREWTQLVLARLDELKDAQPEAQHRIIKSLGLELTNQRLADEEMALFQKNVEKVNAEFYTNLMRHYPKLSPSEKKLCGLIRLNLSGKEIANIRNVDPATVTKSKQRLRKKLSLDSSVDLHAFMQQI